jgi:4-hydroxybenzoate polyprenyltransferase
MYLNDAFDAQFDLQHRPERPIPSGAIESAAVWKWGLCWLILGLISASLLGKVTTLLAVFLAISILVYDAIHKIFAFSPVLMAACRFFLVLLAASAAEGGVTGGASLSIWTGLILAAYIMGLSYLARNESTHAPLRYWPCGLLAAPVVLALVVNQGAFQQRGFLFSVVFIIWTLLSLRHVFWSPQPNVGRTVSGLLAGIVLVDLLAVGGGTGAVGIIFAALFVLALLFQRFIPAT